jgi:hypothetical protein
MLQREIVDVAPKRFPQLGLARVEQVDPLGHPAEGTPTVG